MNCRPNFRLFDYSMMNDAERGRIDDEIYLWEAYYDLHGVKPRWMGISEMSDDELKAAIESIAREWKEVNEYLASQRQALAKARAHPKGIVVLSKLGEMIANDGFETVDENDPEMWNWYIQADPEPNQPIAAALNNLWGSNCDAN